MWPQVSMSWVDPLVALLNISQIPETVFIDDQGNVALFDGENDYWQARGIVPVE